jgi:uncharacterized protein with von Willebrand factor type A (vWA) domain
MIGRDPIGSVDDLGAMAAARLAAFARILRDNGFSLGLRESEDALKLMGVMAGSRVSAVRPALKALFCARRADWQKFDELFDAHWLGRGMRRSIKVGGQSERGNFPTIKRLADRESAQKGDAGLGETIGTEGEGRREANGPTGRMEGASRSEALTKTDFRKLRDPLALAMARDVAERLARAMRTKYSRRKKAARHGRSIDLRRTIHRNISHGGVPIERVFRRRREKPLKLVILLDVSGSMNLYTRFLIRFVLGCLDRFLEAEAYLLHTRLVHVSAAMRERDSARALERLSLMAEGVGGGTRIGECLGDFNHWHAKRVINSRTCVMIISDGYDTGTPEKMADEMRRLAKRCRRIVWLNPMMGWEGFSVEAKALKAALPYIDLLAPAHNLESLAALEPYLARL